MLQLQHLTSGLNCSSVQTRAFRGIAKQKIMDSGYPLDWFVSTPPQTFICEICGKILNTPKSTSCCGESFCCRCLEFWNDYYGICPKRCGELEMDSLRKENKLEKIIQSLPVYCQYSNGGGGCTTMITLAEKQKHERKCQHKPKNTTNSAQSKPTLSSKREKNSSSSSVEKQDTYVEMASVAAKTRERLQQKHLHPSPSCSTAPHIGVGGLAYHTYHLKRRTPGESLGFVLVAGAKNSNGRAVNFSIKTVNPGTVAAEAGLLPGDKILQVDNIGLSQLAQQDAISRIKDNPEVFLTVLRSSGRPLHHHVYEDVKSAEQEWAQTTGEINERGGGETDRNIHNMFLRHQLNVRDRSSSVGAGKDLLRRKRSDPVSDRLTLIPGGGGGGGEAAYKSPTQTTVCSDPTRNHLRYFPEKVGADSGLSSSNSSFSPSPRSLSKPHPRPPPLHEVDHTSTDVRSTERRESRGEASPLSRDVRVEGGYEVEEIYLQKNGTNQLGITLGYDTTNPGGSLYVCEIIPSGLAAQDGRVKKGDIIRKVNGFEVYDPEEAILLFLEQDQDISLTVARRIKVFHHYRKGLMSSKSQNALHSHLNLRESCYHDDDEETMIRRTDSCGSLDSHSHIYRQRGGRERTVTEIRRGSESSAMRHLTASTNNMTISLSSGEVHGGGRERVKSPLVGTDHVFRPIMEGRPHTANQLSVERARGRREGHSPQHTMVHSSPSVDSALRVGRGGVSPHHNSPPVIVTRHHSVDIQRLQAVSPSKPVQPLLAYRPRDVITSNYRRGSGPDGFSPTSGPIGPINRHHSVGNVRCESLV